MTVDNPYVQNEFYFANITNVTYAGSPIAIIRFVNFASAGVIGTIALMMLFYLILFKTNSQFIKFYFYLQSLMQFIWLLIRYRVESGIMAATFIGPAQYLGYTGRCISMIFQNSSPQLTVTFVPCSFYYRYYAIKYGRSPSTLHIILMVSIPILLVSADASLAIPAFCPPPDGIGYERYYWPEVPVPKLLIGKTNQGFAQMTLLYHRVLTFGAYIPTVIFALLSVRELKKKSEMTSSKTKALQRQFTQALTAQALVPFVTLVCPIIGFTVLAWGGISFKYSGEFNVCLLTWAPPLNAISVIVLIPQYRKRCLHMLSCGFVNSKRTGPSATSFVDSRIRTTTAMNPTTIKVVTFA
ncbi:hypothetical protein M3Y95_00318300 [Aphelenchoides besseyi]|nr:hypothetical protein M3Y95_00318300 [Aphelenchoides besseyi]